MERTNGIMVKIVRSRRYANENMANTVLLTEQKNLLPYVLSGEDCYRSRDPYAYTKTVDSFDSDSGLDHDNDGDLCISTFLHQRVSLDHVNSHVSIPSILEQEYGVTMLYEQTGRVSNRK